MFRFHALVLAGLMSSLIIAAADADVNYQLDDGSSELGLGIDPGEDSLLFNRFDVQPGGEIITQISIAYGRPGGVSALNGLPVEILLYEDVDGGSPWNAVLRHSLNAVVANGNSNTLNTYAIPPTEVHGSFLAAMIYRNTTAVNKFIGALDRTLPHLSDASFYGYAVGLDETNLQSIPDGQFGTMESLGIPGNFLVRATGQPIPEPGLAAAGLVMLLAGFARRQKLRQP